MRTLRTHQFRAMGTDCSIVVAFPVWQAGVARTAIAAAVAEVEAQERALSRFDATSDLSALNAAAGRWTTVGDRLFAALHAAVDARVRTDGRYDPTVLPALVAAGYDTTYDQLRPGNAGIAAGWRAGAAIELDHERRRVRLAAGAAVDLGGIGKGLSATTALAAIRDAGPGLTGALVDLGGDIAAWGSAPDMGPWWIAVADPRNHARALGILRVHGGGVATSGRDRRRLGADGSGHHLIDPATGSPAVPGPLAVTVIAQTALEAEPHATALAITPVEEAPAYLADHPDLSAIVVPQDSPPFTVGRPPLSAGDSAIEEVAA